MPKLSKLHLSIPREHMEDFADVFEEASLSLPNIKTLVLGHFDDFIIKHCPNVQTISTDGRHFQRSHKLELEPYTELIKESSKAEKLTYFEMSHLWRCAQLEGQSYRSDQLYFIASAT
jgi:hypothetical protein